MEAFQEQLKKFDGFYTKVLESMESKKKSPYELDLEVMDRKPDITPKVGEWVKIKSKEWYEKWKDSSGNIRIGPYFIESMSRFCGGIYKVTSISLSGNCRLDERNCEWSMNMFEEVYPKEKYAVLNRSGGGHIIIGEKPVMEAILSKEGRIPSEIIPNDGTLLGCDYQQMLDKAFPSYLPSIKELTDPCAITCKVDNDLVLLHPTKKSVQAYVPKPTWLYDFSSLSKPETKLRIIKTNQLIKIEKL